MSLNLPQIPDRLRGPLKYVGYVFFALFVFLVVVYLTFPYDKVKDRLEAEVAAAADLEVSIGHLGPSPLFGVSASDVVLQQKSLPPGVGAGEKKATMRVAIDRASVSVSPLGLLFGRKGVDFSLKVFGGRVSGSYVIAKDDTTLKLKLSGVGLAALPGLKDLLDLPLAGAISGTLDLTMPKGRISQSHGELEISCEGCTVGDGKARLKIPAATAMFAEGVLVDRVALGKFGGRIVIDKGTAKFQSFQAKSPDLELQIEGEIGLSDSLAASSIRVGYISFRPTDAGKKKQPFAMMDLALAQTAKRPDGFFGWRVAGLIKSPSFTASKFSPIQPSAPGRPAVGERPNRREPSAGRATLGSGSIKPPGARSPSPGGPPNLPTPMGPMGGPPLAGAEPPPTPPPTPPLPGAVPGAPGNAPPPPPGAAPPTEQPERPEPDKPEPDKPEQPVQPEQPGPE